MKSLCKSFLQFLKYSFEERHMAQGLINKSDTKELHLCLPTAKVAYKWIVKLHQNYINLVACTFSFMDPLLSLNQCSSVTPYAFLICSLCSCLSVFLESLLLLSYIQILTYSFRLPQVSHPL